MYVRGNNHALSWQMYGARPIRRWVQKNVVTELSELLVRGEIHEGSTICINASDDKVLKYEVVKEVARREDEPVTEPRRSLRRRRCSLSDVEKEVAQREDGPFTEPRRSLRLRTCSLTPNTQKKRR